MNKTTILSLGIVALAGLASANTVSCTVTPSGSLTAYNTGVTPGTNTAFRIAQGESGGLITNAVNCPTVDAGAGNVITNYSVMATGDYTGGPFGTTTGTIVEIDYVTTASAPVGAQTVKLFVTGGNSSVLFSPATPFGIPQQNGLLNPSTQTLAGFNVGISSTEIIGTVGASSGQVVLNYSTAAATPEPATMGLVGSALLGLGFLSRRKK